MYLYRALRSEEIEQGHILIPKAQKPFLSNPRLGMGIYPPIILGKTAKNAVRYHQWKGVIRTSGISTTPHLERAKFYAKREKVIAKIIRTLLFQFGIMEYVVKDYVVPNDITCPEDNEVILVKLDGGDFPKEIIAEIINL